MTCKFIVTGGFDPLHRGHLELFSLGPTIVGVNSDAWLEQKKGTWFLPLEERMAVVSSLVNVERAVDFNDDDGHAGWFLKWCAMTYPKDALFFLNGGDRFSMRDLPKEEQDALYQYNITPLFIASPKSNSSSKILKEYLERTNNGTRTN